MGSKDRVYKKMTDELVKPVSFFSLSRFSSQQYI